MNRNLRQPPLARNAMVPVALPTRTMSSAPSKEKCIFATFPPSSFGKGWTLSCGLECATDLDEHCVKSVERVSLARYPGVHSSLFARLHDVAQNRFFIERVTFRSVDALKGVFTEWLCSSEELQRRLDLRTLLHCLSTNWCSVVFWWYSLQLHMGIFPTTSLGACSLCVRCEA